MFAQPLRRAATVAAAALALVGLWELYRWIWTSAGWTWPFVVDKTSMPHVWTIFRAFGQPTQVNQPALELMRTYAASRWTILWKLRVPASLPYVFAALKLAATASVVGAIIGELPSGLQDGLGGAIINFNQYYSFEPQELWATNVVAAALGILFFVCVVAAERIVVRRAPENVA